MSQQNNFFSPQDEVQRQSTAFLISWIRKLVPSNTSEHEVYEALDFVIRTIREAISGGVQQIANGKAALEEYFGTLLRANFAEIIEHVRKLKDYIIGVSGPNDGSNSNDGGAEGGEKTATQAVLVMQSSDDEDSDDASSSSSSSSDDDSSDDARGGRADGGAAKRRRTEFGSDATLAAHDIGPDNLMMQQQQEKKLTLKQVNKQQFYIRDVRLKPLFPSDNEAERRTKADKILKILADEAEEDITVQSQLTFYFRRFISGNSANAADLTIEIDNEVDFLVANRWVLVFGTLEANAVANAASAVTANNANATSSPQQQQQQFTEAVDAARRSVMEKMKAHAMRDRHVADLYKDATGINVHEGTRGGAAGGNYRVLDVLDLEGLHRQGETTSFDASQKRVKVPNGTRRGEYETHDEIVLPQTGTYSTSTGKKNSGANKKVELKIEEAFPKWATRGFNLAKTQSLNPVQSRVHPVAFKSDDNMLVCAPTGAGKTLVALMTILRVLDNYKADYFGSEFHKDEFKIVYIAPMKALVQEVVQTFSRHLEPFGVQVAELSGDSGLSQQQLAETQMIVATPEKWDIVTRKSAELSVANFVRLIIIDEIHLLHNDRGPILESIVARMILQQQRTQNHCRLVGLSATLPNAEDVSRFMKVDSTKGFFEFDASNRPVPLQQTYCAVKKLPNKRDTEVLNMVTYTKTMQFEGKSVMVFVHSRKDTEFTANYLMQRAIKENQIALLGVDTVGNRRFIEENGAELRDVLKDLIPNGFAVHHAGMSAFERKTVEDLFMEKKIKVLVCTSTLAWGVNLPTHAVIIKGTQIYSPQHKGTTYLSSLDVLQMFGRAGRKGFDTFGEACIITSLNDVYYYLSILNQQLPIESQFVNHLVNALNAEVVLGNVLSVDDGAAWLQHTYHYIRTQKEPRQYGTEISRQDPELLTFRENLIHTAALALAESRMVEYDEDARTIKPTPLGRIASTYYIHHSSMKVYNSMLKATSQEIDLFHIFSMSSEFKQISVRSDEKEELQKLIELCPVPIKEIGRNGIPNAAAKINILLQCYITGANLKGMAIMTEMVYIKDSAQRILRALYDMCVVRDFGQTGRKVHAIYQSVLRHQWPIQCPLRQIMPDVRGAVQTHGANPLLVKKQAVELRDSIRIAEARKNFFYEHYRRYNYKTFVARVFKNDEKTASIFYNWIKKIPRLIVNVTTRPITNGMLKMDITIKMDIAYDPIVHDAASAEMIISVEDSTVSSSTVSKAAAGNTKPSSASSSSKSILFHEVVDASKLIKNGAGGAAFGGAGSGETDDAAAIDADNEMGGDDEDEDGRPVFETTVVVPVSAETKPVYYFVHVGLSSWVGSHVTVPVPLIAVTMPPPPPAPTPLEAFAEKMKRLQEAKRMAKMERRRQMIEANGGDDTNIDFGEDGADDDDGANVGIISLASVVGETLAGAAAELFPFETVSVSQAAAAEAIFANVVDPNTGVAADEASWTGNVYVGMPAGTGKTFLAECVALRLLKENALGLSGDNKNDEEETSASPPTYKHMLYLTATPAQAHRRYTEWFEKYAQSLEQSVILLTGNTVKDAKAIREALAIGKSASSNNTEGDEEVQQQPKTVIVVACAANAAALVQRGVQLLRQFRYLVLDHLHQLGTEVGGVYETVVSRLLAKPHILNDGQPARVLGLSYPVAYPQALSDWLKCKPRNSFSFDNKLMRRLQVTVEGSSVPGARSRQEYQRLAALKELTTKRQYTEEASIVFVPSPQDAMRAAKQLIDLRRRLNHNPMSSKSKSAAAAANIGEKKAADHSGDDASANPSVIRVVGGTVGELSPSEECIENIQNEPLKNMISKHRVAFLNGTLSDDDFRAILRLVTLGELPIVVFAAREDAWRLPAALFPSALIIAAERLPMAVSAAAAAASASSSTALAAPSQVAFADCTAAEMVQMTSRADRRCLVYCRQPRQWYWESLLCNNALMPVTSILYTPADYEASFNSRIAEGSISQLSQCLSVFQSHFFYHMLKVNPAYFGLHSSERSALTVHLSEMCEETCKQLKEAGCILFSEESGTVVSTSVGSAAAKLCVSIDTVRTLMAVATAQLESDREEASATATHTTEAKTVANNTDSVIRSMIQLICNLDEITNLPCASLSSPIERRLLVRIAQDLPSLAAVRTDLTYTTATDKAFVLIMMALARTEYDLMSRLHLYRAKGERRQANNNAEDGHDNDDTARDGTTTADEEDIVIAKQLLKDTEEIITRAEHVAMAAVDIVGRQSFDTSRCLMDVSACLAIRSLPSAVAASGGLSQIPETILPGSIAMAWSKKKAGGDASSNTSLLEDACSASVEPVSSPTSLAAVFLNELFLSSGAVSMKEADVAKRNAMVTSTVGEVSAYGCLISKIVGQQQKTFTKDAVGLTAKAGIVMEHEVFHLNVKLSFNNFLLGSSSDDNANNGLVVWAVCYNANDLSKPLLGLQPIRVPSSTQSTSAAPNNGDEETTSAVATISANLLMPLPEQSEEDASEVILKVMLVPQNVLLLRGAGEAVEADVVVEEGEDEEEAEE